MTSPPHPALSSPPAHPLRLRVPLLTSRCRRRLPLLRSAYASPSPPRAAVASPWSLSPSLTRSSFTVAPASRRAGARSLVSRPRAVADPMGGEAPEPRRLSRALRFGCGGIPDEALHLVMGYVDDPRDREAASLVCHRWHRIDALTRKHVTVAFCYAADPSCLCARFPRLESLALKE